MSVQTQYILTEHRFGHPAGTIVYDAKYHDYGLASDDTRVTGIQHRSVTLDSNGDYPFFTCPEYMLKDTDIRGSVKL